MSVPVIALQDLRKRYGGEGGGAPSVEVLRGISLQIHAGEFVAIVGASGSGKSTLMHLLGCLDQASSGSYHFNGQDVASMDADQLAWLRREAFGFVFQGYHLIATESACENVEVPALYAGLPEAARRARAQQLLQRLGLGDKLQHRPHQLSGGQQQRVSIARALMNGGQILLADEPTGALDSHSGTEVMALLHELADAGHTVILITHDRAVAAQARRVIEIRDGQIVADSGRLQAKSASGAGKTNASSYQNNSKSTRQTERRVLWAELRDALRAAWRVMAANRFRTALTLLGIVIGVASVIVMLAVGTGSQQKVMADMATFGAKAMYVSAMQGSSRDRAAPLTLADAATIRLLPNIQSVAPYIEGRLVVRRGNIDHQTEVGGATTDFSEALSWPLAEGVWFDAADEQRLAKVAILGQTVRKALFADGSSPLGQDILVEGVPFQVIGVLAAKGASGGDDQDERVVVPFSAASARLYGHPNPGWISVLIRDMDQASATGDAILASLAETRGAKDVRLWNQAESIRVQGETERTMTLMLGLIAAISLVVGGIGVMNVMLMTVRERTREIGIRMATGARQRDILRQFLTEAVLVTVVGGAIGVALGLALGAVLLALGVPVVFSLSAMLGAFGCAVATGIVFGYTPAQRAARLDPVVALASE
ncbi:macrolide transport system ATP-binding/permease protein [Rhodoferax sp. OV413]|uniref:MacB family efflux pump subunit n=1 Tax=Rhodoferax sp. OV413 TaxID=1855285 RepID=UPI0008802A9F|nr:MacB family efflux pump subunit [Rhodoferax sp. OV413]SDN94438.1 macrolide transport system ATP-binding/permease protein [Rhodoferax sp. OV413]